MFTDLPRVSQIIAMVKSFQQLSASVWFLSRVLVTENHKKFSMFRKLGAVCRTNIHRKLDDNSEYSHILIVYFVWHSLGVFYGVPK